MRTTLNLEDDVVEYVTAQARLRGVSLGKAATDLIRRGMEAPARTETKDGLTMFRLPPDTPEVTTELVKRLENEGK